MAFFVELTEGDAASSTKNIFDAATVVAFSSKDDARGTDLLINDGDYSSGGKIVHVQETPGELLRMTNTRVPFVRLERVEHEEEHFFYSKAIGTTTAYFNAAAVTNLIPSKFPLPGNDTPEKGASTVVQLSSGKRAHVQEKPATVARLLNDATAP